MFKSFIYKIWFSLIHSKKVCINDKTYHLHYNSKYDCNTNAFKKCDLEDLNKINDIFKLLINSKHIFLSYSNDGSKINIYNRKHGWITYAYHNSDDYMSIYLSKYNIAYELTYVFNMNKKFSRLIKKLIDVGENNNLHA